VRARRRTASLLLACLLLGTAGSAVAQDESEDPRLTRARYLFRHGDYDQAITHLVELLEPVKLERDEEVVVARETLGVCYFIRGDLEKARAQFVELLRLDTYYALDPLLYPPPLVEFYDGIRREIEEELKRIRAERLAKEAAEREAAEKSEKEKPPNERVRVERWHQKENSLLIACVPFGAGQFQNGETGKGIAFLASEVALFTTNIAAYYAGMDLRQNDGTIRPEDEDLAEALRVTQMVSLGLGLAVAAYGVVDALLNFKELEVEIMPGAPVVPPKPANALAPRLSPLLGEQSVGLSGTWRF
jgi:tetratricopeptide (TPR) repeat protein